MHYALPQRQDGKVVHPYVATRSSARRQYLRRARLRQLLWVLGALVVFLFLISQLLSDEYAGTGGKGYFEGDGSEVERNLPYHTPRVIIVTPIDPQYGKDYQRLIVANRRAYAEKHGYDTYTPSLFEWDAYIPGLARSWARIPCMRQAMSIFEPSPWFFFLDQHALIMNTSLPVSERITAPERLASLMMVDQPVAAPTSVIHTLDKRDSATSIDFIISQDQAGLAQTAYLLRRGDWANYFLDSWFEPLYKSYNFARAEGHALEHLIQWHKTILARVAIIPQRAINAYTTGTEPELYQHGDFVARAHGCDIAAVNTCHRDIKTLFQQWIKAENLDRDALDQLVSDVLEQPPKQNGHPTEPGAGSGSL